MPCKKTELVSAINSYAAARFTGDANLQRYAANLLEQLVSTIEFAPEQEEETTPAD